MHFRGVCLEAALHLTLAQHMGAMLAQRVPIQLCNRDFPAFQVYIVGKKSRVLMKRSREYELERGPRGREGERQGERQHARVDGKMVRG